MDNTAPTSSKAEKKKKPKSSKQKGVIDPTAKRSFWKNLFRFKGKRNNREIISDSDTEHDQQVALPIKQLSSIFEEAHPEAKEDSTTKDIENIKQTLKRISKTSNSSKIFTGLNESKLRSEPIKTGKIETIVGSYSTISNDSERYEQEETKTELNHQNFDEKTNFNNEEKKENDLNINIECNVNKEVKQVSKENLTVKDAYSFEYSESSEISYEEANEEKTDEDNKVTFDARVESKDDNSFITVRSLNVNDNKIENIISNLTSEVKTTEEKDQLKEDIFKPYIEDPPKFEKNDTNEQPENNITSFNNLSYTKSGSENTEFLKVNLFENKEDNSIVLETSTSNDNTNTENIAFLQSETSISTSISVDDIETKKNENNSPTIVNQNIGNTSYITAFPVQTNLFDQENTTKNYKSKTVENENLNILDSVSVAKDEKKDNDINQESSGSNQKKDKDRGKGLVSLVENNKSTNNNETDECDEF